MSNPITGLRAWIRHCRQQGVLYTLGVLSMLCVILCALNVLLSVIGMMFVVAFPDAIPHLDAGDFKDAASISLLLGIFALLTLPVIINAEKHRRR